MSWNSLASKWRNYWTTYLSCPMGPMDWFKPLYGLGLAVILEQLDDGMEYNPSIGSLRSFFFFFFLTILHPSQKLWKPFVMDKTCKSIPLQGDSFDLGYKILIWRRIMNNFDI